MINRRTLLRCAAGQLVLMACGGERRQTATPSGSTMPPTSVADPTTVPTTAAPTTTTTAPYPAEERALDIAGSPVLLRFDPGVPAADLAFIAETLPLVRDDLGDCGPLTIHVYSNENDLAGAWAIQYPNENAERIRQQVANNLTQTARYRNWWIYSPNFRMPGPPLRGMHHEYFHILQKHHMQREFFIPQGLPWWVAEGSAEFFGSVAAGNRGAIDFESYRGRYLTRLRQISDPIGAFETEGGSSVAVAGSSGGAYMVGFFASEYLVGRFGQDKWMRDYWIALREPGAGVGQPLGRQQTNEWATAFERVFGISTQQFYVDFETYRPSIR